MNQKGKNPRNSVRNLMGCVCPICSVWTDPDFDPALQAFYYVRVFEIPTPRWTAYDAKRYGSKPMPGTPMVVNERAYTSPIWYTP